MFNDIVLDTKNNEDSRAPTSRKIKEYASKFNDGHWAFLGPGEESKWYQGYATNHGGKWDGGRFRELRTSGIPGGKKIIETPFTSMVNMATLTCCVGLFIPRTSSVSTEQSQSGVEQILEKQAKADPKIRARHPRNSNGAIGSQVIGWYSKTPAYFGKPNAPECKRFQFDAIYEQNWISPYNGEIIPFDWERKPLCNNYSWRWQMV